MRTGLEGVGDMAYILPTVFRQSVPPRSRNICAGNAGAGVAKILRYRAESALPQEAQGCCPGVNESVPACRQARKIVNKNALAERVLHVLRQRYPETGPHLRAASPWQLLVATILSAQCTDARVNAVTPALFARWSGPEQTARAGLDELEDAVRSTGFFRMKARNLLQTARRIMEVYGGEVPADFAALVTLPGVARKTANVVLWGAFGINEGLAVDTHVARISRRLGLTDARDADKIEQDLLVLFPRAEWGDVNHRMVSFGRDVCRARAPRCGQCELLADCPRRGVDTLHKIG